MGKGRWLHQNHLYRALSLEVSSAAPGLVGRAVAETQGAALMYVSGAYRGPDSLKYELVVNDLGQGAQVGQARFRWRTSQDEAWAGEGVPTSAGTVELSHGVGVKWISGGGGEDFVAGDRWSFLAVRHQGGGALVDDDPNTQWCAAGCAGETISVDLGEELTALALVLGWHNLSPTATATLLGDDGGDWESPAFSLELPPARPHLAAFLNGRHRHWRLALADPGNPEGVIRAGALYLGGHLELSVNHAYGLKRTASYQRKERKAGGFLLGASASGRGDSLSLTYRRAKEQDALALLDMLDQVHGRGSGRVRPVWFCPDADRPGELIHGLPGADLAKTISSVPPYEYDLSLSLKEIPRRAL